MQYGAVPGNEHDDIRPESAAKEKEICAADLPAAGQNATLATAGQNAI
jgi:hypothetical protein